MEELVKRAIGILSNWRKVDPYNRFVDIDMKRDTISVWVYDVIESAGTFINEDQLREIIEDEDILFIQHLIQARKEEEDLENYERLKAKYER